MRFERRKPLATFFAAMTCTPCCATRTCVHTSWRRFAFVVATLCRRMLTWSSAPKLAVSLPTRKVGSVVQPDSELVDLADGPRLPTMPYWDVALRHSRSTLAEFLARFDAAQLVTWRTGARASVGIFFVGEKGRRPSRDRRLADLVVPAALSQLMMFDEAVKLGYQLDGDPRSSEGVDCSFDVTGSSADLAGGFYQLYSERP